MIEVRESAGGLSFLVRVQPRASRKSRLFLMQKIVPLADFSRSKATLQYTARFRVPGGKRRAPTRAS